VLEYRRIVEAGIVTLVVERATEADIAELEELLKKMRETRGVLEEFAASDVQFHLALARMTRNPVITKITGVIRDVLSTSMVDIVSALGVDLGLHYHSQLLEAIAARDKNRAQALMAEHIESTIRGMQEKRR